MMLINQSADQKTGNTIMLVFASEETSRKRSQNDVSEASTTVIFWWLEARRIFISASGRSVL